MEAFPLRLWSLTLGDAATVAVDRFGSAGTGRHRTIIRRNGTGRGPIRSIVCDHAAYRGAVIVDSARDIEVVGEDQCAADQDRSNRNDPS